MPAGLHFLVVDDNASNLRIAELILRSIGHSVELVPDADRALSYLAERSYDAVLMDCQMPVVDGYELTRRIRRGDAPGINARIPIIAVTAHALPEDRAKCIDAGMDDYVTKPIRIAELIAAFQRQRLVEVQPTLDLPTSELLDSPTLALAQSLPGINGPSLLPELVRRYLTEQPRLLGLIAGAWHRQTFGAMADHARSLAGEAATLGAKALRDEALRLERAARNGDEDAVETHWRELCAAAAAVRPALARLDLLPSEQSHP